MGNLCIVILLCVVFLIKEVITVKRLENEYLAWRISFTIRQSTSVKNEWMKEKVVVL